MKKLFTFAAALAFAVGAQAQDTYMNNTMVNSTGDVYGTARYVGMAGAMGALGADLSTMSFNPAGLGLYRRSDVAITFGGAWNNTSSSVYTNGRSTFDQAGFVFAKPNQGGTTFAFGFNYQKKLNFGHAFDFRGAPLNGLSQMDQMAELVNAGYATDNNLAGFALDPTVDANGSFEKGFTGSYLIPFDENGNPLNLDDKGHVLAGQNPVHHYDNIYRGEEYDYAQRTWGSLSEFNIDMAFNVKDRAYFGLDLGFENMDFNAISKYSELCSCGTVPGDYTLNNDQKVTGWGFNLKLGTIVRPFAENPLRFGFAVETPTWYSLRNSTMYQLWNDVTNSGTNEYESYLTHRLTTPWKIRASVGSTVGSYLAWDVDYEYANWSSLKQRISDGDYSTKDGAMNAHAKENLKGVHNVRIGLEGKPTSKFAIRAGYGFTSAPTTSDCTFDQFEIDSRAMDYSVRTSYMRLKPSHMITLGLGYKGKSFYADLAYKIRSQKADFYAFDSNFTGSSSMTLDPVEVDKCVHQITASIGFKF